LTLEPVPDQTPTTTIPWIQLVCSLDVVSKLNIN